MAVIGWFGYTDGSVMNATIQSGINFACNILPAICYLLSIVPTALITLKESDMPAIHEKLRIRNAQREAEHAQLVSTATGEN